MARVGTVHRQAAAGAAARGPGCRAHPARPRCGARPPPPIPAPAPPHLHRAAHPVEAGTKVGDGGGRKRRRLFLHRVDVHLALARHLLRPHRQPRPGGPGAAGALRPGARRGGGLHLQRSHGCAADVGQEAAIYQSGCPGGAAGRGRAEVAEVARCRGRGAAAGGLTVMGALRCPCLQRCCSPLLPHAQHGDLQGENSVERRERLPCCDPVHIAVPNWRLPGAMEAAMGHSHNHSAHQAPAAAGAHAHDMSVQCDGKVLNESGGTWIGE